MFVQRFDATFATIAFQAFDVTSAACLGLPRVSDRVDVTVR